MYISQHEAKLLHNKILRFENKFCAQKNSCDLYFFILKNIYVTQRNKSTNTYI